jgi:hypothetical protein
LISNKNFSSFKNDAVQLPPSTKPKRATEESTKENHHNLNEFLELGKKIKISPLQNPPKNPPPKKYNNTDKNWLSKVESCTLKQRKIPERGGEVY